MDENYIPIARLVGGAPWSVDMKTQHAISMLQATTMPSEDLLDLVDEGLAHYVLFDERRFLIYPTAAGFDRLESTLPEPTGEREHPTLYGCWRVIAETPNSAGFIAFDLINESRSVYHVARHLLFNLRPRPASVLVNVSARVIPRGALQDAPPESGCSSWRTAFLRPALELELPRVFDPIQAILDVRARDGCVYPRLRMGLFPVVLPPFPLADFLTTCLMHWADDIDAAERTLFEEAIASLPSTSDCLAEST